MSEDSSSEVEYGCRARDVLGFSRWWQLVAAAAMMAAVSPYQYVWSSIQQPLAERLDIALPALGMVFSFYVVFQSLSQVPAGWWRDRRGPRRLTLLAAILAGGGYVGLAYATSLWQLYLLYSLGSVGVGIIYTVAVNTAVKWFPDRRGLTTGIGTMAFAAGSALVVPYVRANATVEAYPSVLRNVGLVILVVLLVGTVVLRDPPRGWDTGSSVGESESADPSESPSNNPQSGSSDESRDGSTSAVEGRSADDATTDSESDDAASANGRTYGWREVITTWQFWLLYAMFVAISGADLLVVAQIVDFAEHLGFAAVIATISATVLPLASGGSRIVLGALADVFETKHVMAVSFVLAGGFRLLLVYAGLVGGEIAFVALVVLAMFFSSPLYVFFPSLLAEYYGTRYSSENYALLYTAKIGGGVFSGVLAGVLVASTGWTATFVIGGLVAIAAGGAAAVLRPPASAT